MLSLCTSSYGCAREVWRAREKRKSCSRRSREQLWVFQVLSYTFQGKGWVSRERVIVTLIWPKFNRHTVSFSLSIIIFTTNKSELRDCEKFQYCNHWASLQILVAILPDLNKFFLLADFLFNKRFFLNPKGKYITNEEIYIEFQNGIV